MNPELWVVTLALLNIAGAAAGAWFGVRHKIESHEKRLDAHSRSLTDLQKETRELDIRVVKLER